MSHQCEHCHDTGSLSKSVEGFLDCTSCTIAGERAGLEIWALRHGIRAGIADLFLIYQHGKNNGLEEAARICDETYVEPGDLQVDRCHEAAALIRAKRGGNES